MTNRYPFPETHTSTNPDIEGSGQVCLQNFLYDYSPIGMENLWGHSSHPVQRSETKISSFSFHKESESTLSFDGLANVFPLEYFRTHSTISHVCVKTNLKADSAHLIIFQTPLNGQPKALFNQTLIHFDGEFSTDWIDIREKDGTLHLEISYQGILEISQTSWAGMSPEAAPSPSFLLSITAFNRDEFVLPLLESLCSYIPLLSLNLRILIVDNGGSLSTDKLPDDQRIRFIQQENLGCTSGVMRALTVARDLKTDFMVIADDDIALPPEMLYRLLIFQTLSNKPLSIGAGMLTLQNPDILWEKGALVKNQGLNSLNPLHKRTDLSFHESLTPLFRLDKPDYTALWLMSAPTLELSFLPSFFIYYEDVLQGLLLQKKGVQIVVPPHIFLWHATLEKRGAFWKRYLWVRNDLATRFLNPEKLKPWAITFSFLKLMGELVMSYDYKLADYHLRAFKEAVTDASWTANPMGEMEKTKSLIRQNPDQIDLSSRLPKGFPNQGQKESPFIFRLTKRLGNLVTLGNYLNPFSRSVRSDGKLAFRFHSDYESWGWYGYDTIAVVDKNGIGYQCKKSWMKAIKLIYPCISLSFRFLTTQRIMTQRYKHQSKCYERAWRDAFSKLDEEKSGIFSQSLKKDLDSIQ